MKCFIWISTAVLAIHTSQAYILLTANLEDVHAIAKQLAESPVAEQLKKIWRRASSQFSMQVAKGQGRLKQRADDDVELNSIEEDPSRKEVRDDSIDVERRHGDDVQGLDQPDGNQNSSSIYLSNREKVDDNATTHRLP